MRMLQGGTINKQSDHQIEKGVSSENRQRSEVPQNKQTCSQTNMPGSKETKKQASTAKHTAKQAKETNKNLCKSATAIAASSFKL